MAVSKITRNYQVTLPREIREMINAKVGDTVLFVREGGQTVIRKLDKDVLENSFGVWKTAKTKTPWLVKRLRGEAEKRLKGLKK